MAAVSLFYLRALLPIELDLHTSVVQLALMEQIKWFIRRSLK